MLDLACLTIYDIATSPELFACLTIYENAETLSRIISVTLRPVSGADIISLTTDEHLLQHVPRSLSYSRASSVKVHPLSIQCMFFVHLRLPSPLS